MTESPVAFTFSFDSMRWNPYLDAARRIPPGEARSFLELAAMAGRPGAARAAGRALRQAAPGSRIPWHRIVSSDGSFVEDTERAQEQLRRLRREGSRPKDGESLRRWSRRLGISWIGSYRTRTYQAADDPSVESWSSQAAEPFSSEAAALARGFTRADGSPPAPASLPRKSSFSRSGVRRAGRLERRIQAIDWSMARSELMSRGCFAVPALLSPPECRAILDDASDPHRFERRVDMAPRGFGVGTYHYFREPLPEAAETMRRLMYERLHPLANDVRSRQTEIYPASLKEFWSQCRGAGQKRASSILLCYQTGGINHLHRDIYGKRFFPFQVLAVLNKRGRDFEGGEFVLADDASGGRRSVVAASEGDVVIFASRDRWLEPGGRRHRIPLRHGMQLVTRGERYALGIVFHLAE